MGIEEGKAKSTFVPLKEKLLQMHQGLFQKELAVCSVLLVAVLESEKEQIN